MTSLLALVAFQAATFDPLQDPAFAKPITVHLGMEPLRKVVAALAKETGQPLTASGVVGDWKATVLVKALPAGRTMEALADTMGLVWKKDGGNVLLARREGEATAESDYRKSEAAQAQKSPMLPVAGEATNMVVQGRRPGRVQGRRVLDGEASSSKAVYARFNPTLLTMESGDSAPASRLEPPIPSGSDPFTKAVLAWPVLPQKVDEAWGKLIPATAPAASSWNGGFYSLADLLMAWHDATGLPVVADAFRIAMEAPTAPQGSSLELLQGIAARNQLALRLTDGVARVRHPAFWRLRDQEITEAAWGGLERSKTPRLDDYVSFATRLSDAQASTFRSRQPPLSHVSTIPLHDSYPALRLWSVLSANARRAVLSGTPVPLSAVPTSTNAYAFALREAPYYRAGDPTEALRLPPNQLGYFGVASGATLSIRLGGERGNRVAYLLPL